MIRGDSDGGAREFVWGIFFGFFVCMLAVIFFKGPPTVRALVARVEIAVCPEAADLVTFISAEDGTERSVCRNDGPFRVGQVLKIERGVFK